MKKSHKINTVVPQDVIFTISNNASANSIQNEHQGVEKTIPADYETAVKATGFGKFNYLLLLASVPATWTGVFDTSGMSYIFPAAQCYLSLTLEDKGMLNAIVFLGMILSAFLWGFLADTYGRQKLLIYGFLVDGIINIFCAFSQSFKIILLFKFISGFIICGPFAILISFLSEFHSTQYRSKVILMNGILLSSGNLVLPCLGWLIFPRDISLNITDTYVLHSWQIFMLVCTTSNFLATIMSALLPETPKFLMSCGRNEEALKVFQYIYEMNTGNPKESYPIKELVQEINTKTEKIPSESSNQIGNVWYVRDKVTSVVEGWNHIRPIFFPPYLTKIIHVCLTNCAVLVATNTLRLWLPQFFKTMDDYRKHHKTTGTMCEILEFSFGNQSDQTMTSRTISNPEKDCGVIEINGIVYINSIIVGLTFIVGYILVICVINRFAKKPILVFLLFFSGLTGFGIYWTAGSISIVALSSVTVALSGVGCMTLMSAIIEIFPTSLRTMAVSLSLMSGRVGSITGNLLFPVLLMSGCIWPFLLIGMALIVCGLLVLLLPPPAKEFK